MQFVADLHIHSKYSRACSRDCDLEHLAWWAARKGVAVVGTGDICHPAWAAEIRSALVPAEPGLFRLRPELERDVLRRLPASCRNPVRFMLSVEISTIYKRLDLTRKVHHLLYVPDLAAMDELTRQLARVGNLGSDGRPILGLDSRDLLEITLAAGAGSYLVPAHIWTPWFAALGSRSGFDSIADCYADLAEHIFAVETGLSSDPAMNWRVSGLDRYRLVSNSDAHSPPALAREATRFDTDLDYFSIQTALRTGVGFGGTVEFFPEEGKYHLDGHRACDVRLEPAETRARGESCPVCGKPVTVGVQHRVEALADRPAGSRPAGAADFRCLVQLPQVVGEIHGVGPKSKRVEADVAALVARLGPELDILQRVPLDDIATAGSTLLAEALGRLRRGEVLREAGYDGEYGVIRLFHPKELADSGQDSGLFDLPTPVPVPTRGARSTAAAPSRPPAVLPSSASGAAAGPGGPGPATGSARPAGEPAAAALVPAPLVSPEVGGAGAGLLGGLDPDQRAAAEVLAGPLLVVAGPGTGKTRTLTHRIAQLVTSGRAAAAECLAITFTRRAAEEMRERLDRLVPAAAQRTLVTTFHALGLRILREQAEHAGLAPGFRIAAETERLTLLRAAFGDRAGRDPRRLLAEVSRLTRSGAGLPGSPAGGPEVDAELAGALARYRAGKRAGNLVDLDDLLALPVALLRADPELTAGYRARWQWISVDEYQDVDETQYRLLRLLCPADGNLCAIGDPDQAIYGFRGADVGFFLRFQADFPAARVVRLTRNYRSSPTILRAALDAIAPATLVPDRMLVPAAPAPGAADRVVLHTAADERAEAGYVVQSIERLLGGSSFLAFDQGRVTPGAAVAHSFAEIAVLYRTDAQARALVDALEAAGVPYQKRSHHRLTDQPGVAEVLAVLRATSGGPAGAGSPGAAAPRSVLARLRAAGQAAIDAAGGLAALAGQPADDPDDGIGADAGGSAVEQIRAALELLTPLAELAGGDLDRFLGELALGAEVDVWDPRADRISLLTLHAAKGLEFPAVFVVGCEDGLLPLRWAGAGAGGDGTEELSEERRLFFVGMTRARSHLLLTMAQRRAWRGEVRDTMPSRFLADIDGALLERGNQPVRRRNVQLRLL
jgi:superfamily I DNA/RNA helicase/PHP family Zn ribbon phosphoesterase